MICLENQQEGRNKKARLNAHYRSNSKRNAKLLKSPGFLVVILIVDENLLCTTAISKTSEHALIPVILA